MKTEFWLYNHKFADSFCSGLQQETEGSAAQPAGTVVLNERIVKILVGSVNRKGLRACRDNTALRKNW